MVSPGASLAESTATGNAFTRSRPTFLPRQLSDEELTLFVSAGQRREVVPREMIFRKGELGRAMFVIESGTIQPYPRVGLRRDTGIRPEGERQIEPRQRLRDAWHQVNRPRFHRDVRVAPLVHQCVAPVERDGLERHGPECAIS